MFDDSIVSTVPAKPGKFVKGKSGNPAGRPKGSRNAISLIKLQVEGELRAQMRGNMQAIVAEMLRQALPTPAIDKASGAPLLDSAGNPVLISGDRDMLKTLFKSWVSGTKASDEDAPKDKIQIVIGKLDQVPPVNGKTYSQSNGQE